MERICADLDGDDVPLRLLVIPARHPPAPGCLYLQGRSVLPARQQSCCVILSPKAIQCRLLLEGALTAM